jgi:NAD(P)-dependent dehydrogenase (short-subunit alcohol dehydrogenase family)
VRLAATARRAGGRRRRWLSHVPLGRAADAGEGADVIVFLASRRASLMTGAVVHHDRGHRGRV